MHTSVDVPTQLFTEIQLRAAQQGEPVQAVVADLLRKGLDAETSPATTALPASTEMLQRRREIVDKYVSGEWSLELAGYEEARQKERQKAAERAEAWRD